MAHSSADSSLAKAFTIALNGQPVAGRKVAGFWTPHEPIHSGDGLQIHFVPSWSVTALPDRPSMGCLSYGPYVMAALMDNRNLLVTQPNGIFGASRYKRSLASWWTRCECFGVPSLVGWTV